MAFGYSWDEQQQDPFESSFFQQPQASAPQPEPAPQRDPFSSSVFESPTMSRQAPAPAADAFETSGSFRAPGRGGLELREPRPSTPAPAPGAEGQPQQPFDFSGLMDKVRTAVDPREKAIAQDSLARSTYAQLEQAGHKVQWKGDQLIVDGRPYVIGDGAPPAGAQPAGGQPPVNDSRLRPDNGGVVTFQDDPSLARPHSAAAGATAAPAAPAATGGGTAQTPQQAYDEFAASIDPNASREDMEAAIERYFGHLPGYGGAYKESVMLNGRWYDMVAGYGGAGASFQGLTPKGPSAPKSSMFDNSLMSSLLSPFGQSGGTATLSGGVEGARGVDLSLDGLNPALLAMLQQPQAPEPDPLLNPSYMGLLR